MSVSLACSVGVGDRDALSISSHIARQQMWLVLLIVAFAIPNVASSITSCAGMSNSSTSPTLIVSDSTIVLRDCSTALASWNATTTAMQIVLSPSNSSTVLQNIYLEIAGASVLPNITVLPIVELVSNVTVVLRGLVAGGGVAASLPPLQHSLFSLEARRASASNVTVTLADSVLVAPRGSWVTCIVCADVLVATSWTLRAFNVSLPAAATDSYPTSLCYMQVRQGMDGLEVMVQSVFPVYGPVGAAFQSPPDLVPGWVLSVVVPFGNATRVSMQLDNITLPNSRSAVRFEVGNPSTNANTHEGRLQAFDIQFNGVTLLNSTGHFVTLRAFGIDDVNVSIANVSPIAAQPGRGPDPSVFGGLIRSADQTTVGAFVYAATVINMTESLSYVRRLFLTVTNYTLPATVRIPPLNVQNVATISGVSLTMRRAWTMQQQQSALSASTIALNELLVHLSSNTVITDVVIALEDVDLSNLSCIEAVGSLKSKRFAGVTFQFHNVAVSGQFSSTMFAVVRTIQARAFPDLACHLRGVHIDAMCTMKNGDCSFFRTAGSYLDDLSGVNISVANSVIIWNTTCPIGFNCPSSVGVFELIDGRWTSGSMVARNCTVTVVTHTDDHMNEGAGVRGAALFNIRGAPVSDLPRATLPFNNCTGAFEDIVFSMTAPLGSVVRFVGAVAVVDFEFRYSNVVVTAVFSDAIFADDILSYSPNFAVFSCTVPMQRGSITLSSVSMSASGVGGIPLSLVGHSFAQSVAVFAIIVAHIADVAITVTQTSLAVDVANGTLTRLTQLDALGSMMMGQLNAAIVMIQPIFKQCTNVLVSLHECNVSAAGHVRADPLATVGAVSIAATAVQMSNCTDCAITVRGVRLRVRKASVELSARMVEAMPLAVAVFAQPVGGFASQTITNPFVKAIFVATGLDAPSTFTNVTVFIDDVVLHNDVDPSLQQPLVAAFSPPNDCYSGTNIYLSRVRIATMTPVNDTTRVAHSAIVCGIACVFHPLSGIHIDHVDGAYPGVFVTTRGSSQLTANTRLEITNVTIMCGRDSTSSLPTGAPRLCGLIVSLPNAFRPLKDHALAPAGTTTVIFPSNLTIAGALFVHRNRLIGFQALTTTIVQLSLSTAAYLQTSAQVDARTATLQLGCNVVDGVRFPSTAVSRQAMRAALGSFPPSAVVESAQHAAWDGLVCRWANWTATPEVVLPATTQLLAQRPFDRAAGGAAWAALVTAPLFHGAGVGGGLASLQGAATVLRLQLRCAALTEREATGVDAPDDVAVGAALSENPLQLSIAALGPQAATAAGAVVGNLAIIAAAGALSLALRTSARRLLAVPTGSSVTPLRSACRVLADIVPRSPASLVVPTLLLLQPLVALSVFLWATAGDAAAAHPAARAVVGVLGAAHCAALAAAVSWKLLWSWRGADGGADTAFPLRTVPNRQFQARRSLATLRRRALVTLFTPSVLWVPSHTTAPGRAVVRGWSRYALLFEGYRERCYWFLLVELAFGAAGGVVAGVMSYAASAANDDADAACSAAQSGGWVMAALLAAQLVVIACLRPYAVLMDAASNATILACSLVSEVISLVSASNSPAAEALLLVASVVEGLAILSTVLIDVVGYVRQHGSSLWAAGALCVARLKSVLEHRAVLDGKQGSWHCSLSAALDAAALQKASRVFARIVRLIPERVHASVQQLRRMRLAKDTSSKTKRPMTLEEHRVVALETLIVWAAMNPESHTMNEMRLPSFTSSQQ